jgi:UDP-N-acetylglucosamine diphosphorylase/glucosamine-1-phosphate N-acetyltransferase
MRVVIYEDDVKKFYPLINLFPQFGLRLGAKTIAECTAQFFAPDKMDFVARAQYGMVPAKLHEPALYLSGRLLLKEKFKVPEADAKLVVGSEPVGFFRKKPPFPVTLSEITDALGRVKGSLPVDGIVIKNIWDLIAENEKLLLQQLKAKRKAGRSALKAEVKGTDIHVDKSARVHKLVSLDATDGPVYIDEHAELRPFSTVIGPCYIGAGTVIERARVAKSSIGPQCRIGGEVEGCIFQGYSNKHHEGFIGHSYVGEWVNLGALTTNSDLKNNYGAVRVHVHDQDFDTGMIKVGCFIGDHVKLGIGTLIPTGTVIGSFVNFAGGGMTPTYIRDFKWIVADKVQDYDLDKAVKTAQIVMGRRNVNISEKYKEVIRKLHGEICRSD